MTSQLPEISYPEFASEHLSEHSEEYAFNLFGKSRNRLFTHQWQLIDNQSVGGLPAAGRFES